MKEEGKNTFAVKHRQASNYHLCPECGMLMREADRSQESEFVFIWWECSRENCCGQWLEKKVTTMMMSAV